MCAIQGVLSATGQPIDVESFVSANNLVSHRGPDDTGYIFVGDVSGKVPHSSEVFTQNRNQTFLALGHQRLSILDLSSRGRQPMVSRDGRYALTFNGEIYNYLEVRETLKSAGRSFETSTDSEVLLQAFQEWGKGCLHRFNGMWAFAIWDFKEETLFLSRDRFGVKPLYFSSARDSIFGFSSEIKQLRHLGFGSGRAHYLNSARFLMTGDVDDTRETLFEGIFRLLPGEYAECKVAGSKIVFDIAKYYELPGDSEPIGKDQWIEGVRDLLESSVRLRLRADVTAGSCLSGGLDSSSIVCLVHKVDPTFEQATFTSRFHDPKFDEFHFASEVISKVCANSHVVFPDLDSLWGEDLDRLIWHQDEPFVSTSIYAQWKVMDTARAAGVKVLLDGQGGDEVFAGYDRYIPYYLAGPISRGNPLDLLSRLVQLRKGSIHSRFSTLFKLFGSSLAKLAKVERSSFSPLQRVYFSYDQIDTGSRHVDLKSRMKFDIYHSLQALLRFEDRNSMAHSIEARTPFLDYRLVEWAMRGEENWFFERGISKAPLRSAMSDSLPARLLNRKDKMGFVTPEIDWYGMNAEKMGRSLLRTDSNLYPWIDKHALCDYLAENGLQNAGFAPWRWLVFDRWMTKFQLSS